MTSKSTVVLSFLLAAVLVLLTAPAWALGLGQLQVKSKPGQPLVAEIPIISSDPSELENLQARLASPDTFRRVGLEPPGSEVTGLQFAVALDARGNPVIRVTSATPLQQPQLTFLLEVDWGQGRLVREYSALVDVPRTVAAPVQPIQAPTAAPSNTIVRPPASTASPVPVPPAPATASREPAKPQPTAPAVPRPSTSIAPSAPPPASVPAAAPSASTEYRVRRGDTLNRIAAGIDRDGHSMAQTMLALLRANPQAFIDDNINLVKAGAVLRMPRGDELSRYGTREAAALVRTQIAQWRQMQAPQRQPDATGQAVAGDAGATSNQQAPPAGAGARLEIVPPSSGDGQRAGTRSGIAAGGEGDMERQQLQQTKETLAARDAEVQELKSRVAELEKLQKQQQQLIQMKDSALATAQQNLAKASATSASTAQPGKAADSSAGPWLWGGLAVLVLALLAWFLARGRRTDIPRRERRFDSSVFAAEDTPPDAGVADVDDAIDPGTGPDENADPAPTTAVVAADEAPEQAPADAGIATPVQPPHWTAAPALVGTVPTWHAGGISTPARAADTRDDAPETDSPARKIELARAYLDLGDDDVARALLLEAMDGRDPAARETAARMLRDL